MHDLRSSSFDNFLAWDLRVPHGQMTLGKKSAQICSASIPCDTALTIVCWPQRVAVTTCYMLTCWPNGLLLLVGLMTSCGTEYQMLSIGCVC